MARDFNMYFFVCEEFCGIGFGMGFLCCSFGCFCVYFVNKKKQTGVFEQTIEGKKIIEAVV